MADKRMADMKEGIRLLSSAKIRRMLHHPKTARRVRNACYIVLLERRHA